MLTKVQDQIYPLENWEFEIFQDEQGNYCFHAATVCDYFEFKNASVTVQRYVDEDWRFKAPIELGRGSDSWMIKEPGLYQLAMAAKTPQAKKFQRWVYSDVLPKLRASGVCIASTATSESIKEAIEAHFVKKDRETELIIRNVEKHFQATENYLTGKSSYLSNIWKRGSEIEKQWAGEILRDTERIEAVSKILKDSIVKLYQVCSNGKRNEIVLGKILESIKPL